MDKELKAKWVAELRSGAIKQGHGKLLDESGAMCCIGVLGRICGISDAALMEHATRVRGEGLEALNALEGEHPWDLAAMNDQGDTFAEIADYIEANL